MNPQLKWLETASTYEIITRLGKISKKPQTTRNIKLAVNKARNSGHPETVKDVLLIVAMGGDMTAVNAYLGEITGQEIIDQDQGEAEDTVPEAE